MNTSLKALAGALLCAGIASTAHADIAFSGSWNSNSTTSGSIAPGLDWGANLFGTRSWGAPGVGITTLPWPSTESVNAFHISFQLPEGIDIVYQQASNCSGGSEGGTVFCSTPYLTPWIATLDGPDSISFLAPSGSSLSNTDTFFVNIFFSGDVREASFEGRWSMVSNSVPEPGVSALLGLGVLGLVALRRRRQ
jgi:hypothetical protein